MAKLKTAKWKYLVAPTVLAGAVLISAGVTLAVVTSDNGSTATLVGAEIELNARAENIRIYSAVPANSGDENVFYSKDNVPYKHVQGIQSDSGAFLFTSHEGSVTYDNSIKELNINNIMPGDKIEFDIAVTSDSTIAFNYRALLFVDKTEGEKLLNQLDFSAGDLGLRREALPELGDGVQSSAVLSNSDELNNKYAPAVLTDYTEWTTFGANQTSIENIHVSVSLPIDATDCEGESVEFRYVARGVQNTEAQPDIAEITVGDSTVNFKTLADAVRYAEENGVNLVRVKNSTVLEEGTVVISNALKIEGVFDEKGNAPLLKGARFSVIDGAAATFENLKFGGKGYLDISNCTAVTLNNCVIEAEAMRYFDSYNRTYLQAPAFIVSGSAPTPNRLTMTDCTFNTKGGAAVNLRTRLMNGSEISGNTFGSEKSVYDGTAAFIFSGAAEGAILTFHDNTVYGNSALSLGNSASASRFTVNSQGNSLYNATANAPFVKGTANAAFIDSGSVINGASLTTTDIAHEGLMFGCVDATLNDAQRISSGKIVLSENITYADFYLRYVSGGTLGKNALALYSEGKLIGHLNSSDNEQGFVVDLIDAE